MTSVLHPERRKPRKVGHPRQQDAPTEVEVNIENKANRPLTVPLPRGKKLHLGVGMTGQINAKAATHPALVKLIEAGELEILDGGRNTGSTGGAASGSTGPSSGNARRTTMNKGGDRSS